MKICIVPVLAWMLIQGAASMTHTLLAFYTYSTEVPNLPEFMIVGILNGLTTYQYDSRTRRAVPKQDWMHRVTQVDPHFWEWNTQRDMADEQVERGHMKEVKRILNESDELPRVSFLQKSSSSPVTCHATGFYPDKAMMFWAKDGVELEDDPVEILPNHDGTFQTSVSLDLSSVPTEDWGRYSCVFQLSGAPEDLVTKLDPKLIRTNAKKQMPIIYVSTALVSVAAAAGVVVAGVVLYRKLNDRNN